MSPEALPPMMPRRIGPLDAIRGLAIVAMVVFHLDWDLADLGFVQHGPAGSPAWTAFGHLIAATFLALSGIGLTLGQGRGMAHALRRIGLILAAALAVTAATGWLFPRDMITFGILHCIAATNLVALPLVRAPAGPILIFACACILAPLVLTTGLTEGPTWWWLGLSAGLPHTLDYRPVLPWLGVVLIGLIIGRRMPIGPGSQLRGPAMTGPAMTTLSFAGRHSLLIYLLHQPLMFGLLSALAAIMPPGAAMPSASAPVPLVLAPGYMSQCEERCTDAGAGLEGCRAACACVGERMSSGGVAGTIDGGQSSRLEAISRACLGMPHAPPGDSHDAP